MPDAVGLQVGTGWEKSEGLVGLAALKCQSGGRPVTPVHAVIGSEPVTLGRRRTRWPNQFAACNKSMKAWAVSDVHISFS